MSAGRGRPVTGATAGDGATRPLTLPHPGKFSTGPNASRRPGGDPA